NIFVYCHEAFEELLRAVGIPLETIISSREQIIPLAHAEADFKKPFRVGVLVTTRATVAQIGDRSFRMQYEMADEKGELLARATTVHVAVDPASGRSTALSPRVREALARHHAAR
ncbi:MAG TPA: thioesterase family protein, partial [Myxococcales bacterium]|nr:thioesterase family protein [Myxococcales bacterium]